MIEIKSRWADSKVLYKSDTAGTIRQAVEEAAAQRVDLSDANLSGANLSGANLSYANLSDANLSYANLSYANLSYANLSYAKLSDANLSYANLSCANLSDAKLSDANLSGANLSDANLSDANLSYANLSYANLSYANLSGFKNDLFEILLNAPLEVAGLREKLIAGEIDGSCYSGECACLVGTLAKLRGVCLQEEDGQMKDAIVLPGIKPKAGRPAEVWFSNLHPGCTPDKNAVAAITLDWIQEFQLKMSAAVAALTAVESKE